MKLNIGCGEDHLEGYINLDKSKKVKPDIVCNLGVNKIKLKDNTINEIRAYNTFQNFNKFIKVVAELARVSKNGCIWKITLPYATSTIYNLINPHHNNPLFTEHSFAFWDNIYEKGQPKWFSLDILKTTFEHNEELWGKNSDEKWANLRLKYLNVVKQFYQEIRVVKNK